jgi:hypothetical protein
MVLPLMALPLMALHMVPLLRLLLRLHQLQSK